MNVVDTAMNFGNAVNLVAVLFLMQTVIKDKNALKGFSVSGTFLTSIAIIGFEAGFFLMENYVSFALGLITLAFWLMVFVFSLRTLVRERKKPPVN